ncbi:MAG: hypothetical protein RR614_07380 [Eubacterium sp.]
MNIREIQSDSIDTSKETIEKYQIDVELEAPLLETIKFYEDQMFHFIMGLLI